MDARPVDREGGGGRADEVAEIDQTPVAQQARAGDLPVGPGKDDQTVASEELGAADQHQDEAE